MEDTTHKNVHRHGWHHSDCARVATFHLSGNFQGVRLSTGLPCSVCASVLASVWIIEPEFGDNFIMQSEFLETDSRTIMNMGLFPAVSLRILIEVQIFH